MPLNPPLEPRPRAVRFTYRGPELAFAVPQGDLDVIGDLAGACCQIWNGGNSVIISVDKRGYVDAGLAEAAAEWLIDLLLVHPSIPEEHLERLTRIVPRERIVRWDDYQLKGWVHPLYLQPAYVEPAANRPLIRVPSYSRGAAARLLPFAFGCFDKEDRTFYERAFDFEEADDADLALVDAQLDGWSPLRQSTYLCHAYTQSGGSFPAKTLWVFERASFSSVVDMWNARAQMSVWGGECRLVAVPRQALANERVMARIGEWVGVRGGGHMKPELLIAADTTRARADAVVAVEGLGIKRMTAKTLSVYFGKPPEDRDGPEYEFFQWLDGPMRRGLVVDAIEVVVPGHNSFFVEPPVALRFRDHGGQMYVDIQELPLAVPLNWRSGELVYQNGTAHGTAVSIRTLLPRGRHLLAPTVPGAEESLRAYLSQYGYSPQLSQDGVLASRLLDRFESRADLDALAEGNARAILEDLAPDHRKKLARRLARELGDRASQEQLADLLRREAAFIELESRTLEQISSRTGVAFQELLKPLEGLVDLGLVARGSAIRCPQCRIRQFLLLAAQAEQIVCSACRFQFTLPVLNERATRELPMSYRLDGLMARGMDQDVLPPLLALRWALARAGNPPEGAFWPGLELRLADDLVAEVDVVVSDRSQMLFIEAKRSASTVQVSQLRRLVEVSRRVGARPCLAAMSGEFALNVARFADRNGLQMITPAELSG